MDRAARARGALVPGAIVGIAAVLRLWSLGQTPYSPFYDAAVRSMTLSWHNFFFGALEPGGSVSVDKAPVDLWFQVVSVKLFGFNKAALHLPEALGGIAAVALLYVVVRSAFGRLAGAVSALALALLPMSVLTSRSDTMDSVMTAAILAALWASLRALRTGRARWVVVAAALVGLAFNIKLTQALVPLPALAVMWWAVRRGRARVAIGAGALAALVIVSMAWIFTASLTPASKRPYPIGSETGSIYRVVFVFNGLDRLRGNSNLLAPQLSPSKRGPTRLLRSTSPFYGLRIGVEIVAGVLLGFAALLAMRRGPPRRAAGPAAPAPSLLEENQAAGPAAVGFTPREELARRWLVIGLMVWFVVAVVLFSAIRNLQPRYLETLSPAPAGLIGIAAAALIARARERRGAALLAGALVLDSAYAIYVLQHSSKIGAAICLAATAATLVLLWTAQLGPHAVRLLSHPPTPVLAALVSIALFAAPAQASIDLVSHNSTDAPTTGKGMELSPFLRARTAGDHYEAAATNFYDVAGLVMTDARPILVLNDVRGIIVHLAKLQQLVRAGALHYIVIGHACHGGRHCPGTTHWALDHSTLVHAPNVYRFNAGV